MNELLSQIKERYPETEVVMMSGYSSMEACGEGTSAWSV